MSFDRVDGDLGARDGAVDQVLQGRQILGDLEVERQDLAALGVEEEDVGLPELAGEQIGGVLGAHDGVDDVRIADEHVGGSGQADDDRLVEADADELRRAGRHLRRPGGGAMGVDRQAVPGDHEAEPDHQQGAKATRPKMRAAGRLEVHV